MVRTIYIIITLNWEDGILMKINMINALGDLFILGNGLLVFKCKFT